MASRKKAKSRTHYDWPEFDYAFNFGLLTPTNEDLPDDELTGFSIPTSPRLRSVFFKPVLLGYGSELFLLQFYSWGTLKYRAYRAFPQNTLARVRVSDIEGIPHRKETNPIIGLLPPVGISQTRAGVFFIFNEKIEFMDLKGELYDCGEAPGLYRPRK
jgi:hypothetical protein